MKVLVIIVCFFVKYMVAVQELDTAVFCGSEWFSDKRNYELSKKRGPVGFSHDRNGADATSYLFNADGTFAWDDNPSCGTNAYQTSGKGTWKYQDYILILNFNNVMTEQRGNRKIEKYKIVKLDEKELILERL